MSCARLQMKYENTSMQLMIHNVILLIYNDIKCSEHTNAEKQFQKTINRKRHLLGVTNIFKIACESDVKKFRFRGNLIDAD